MIILAALVLSQVDLIALGRARADFGEIPKSGKWKFVFASQFGGTEIYFPSGRADVRFYIVGLSGAGLRISKQSKHYGEIRKEWLIELNDSSSKAVSPKIRGTLGDLVSNYDLPINIEPKVRKELGSKSAYAVYHPQGGHSGPMYTFLKFGDNPFISHGQEKLKLQSEWIIGPSDNIPRTKSPYPITREEREEIKNGIAQAKN